MKSLFIDTASGRIIVAVISENRILSICNEENGNDLSMRIFPIIDNVLKEASVSPMDIDVIYVVNGPGSFTGVRIGVTIAKTMAWALNKKIIALSELELMATTPFVGDYIIPFIDARRDASFAGIYDKDGNVVLGDQYITNDDLIKAIPNGKKGIFVSYDHTEKLNPTIPNIDIIKMIMRHQSDKARNPHEINPEYLKKTEAEENLEKSSL